MLALLESTYGDHLEKLSAADRARWLQLAARIDQAAAGGARGDSAGLGEDRHQHASPKPAATAPPVARSVSDRPDPSVTEDRSTGPTAPKQEASPEKPSQKTPPQKASPQKPTPPADAGKPSRPATEKPKPSATETAPTASPPSSESSPSPSPDGSSSSNGTHQSAAANVRSPRWQDLVEQAIARLERELAEARPEGLRSDGQESSGSEASVSKPRRMRLTDSEQARREVLLRLLRLVADDADGAVLPFEHLEGPEADYWRAQLFALHLGVASSRPPRLAERATRMLEHLREATQTLAAASRLDLRHAAFCRHVYGYADIEPFRPYVFRPDQEVLLYVEIENFAAERVESTSRGKPARAGQGGAMYETEFRGSYEIRDANQRRVVDHELPLDKQRCRNWRRDYYIAYRLYMPKRIDPGRYTLILSIEDVKGQKFGQALLDFEIAR